MGVADIHLPFLCSDRDAKDSVQEYLLRTGENVIKIARSRASELNRQLLFFCHWPQRYQAVVFLA